MEFVYFRSGRRLVNQKPNSLCKFQHWSKVLKEQKVKRGPIDYRVDGFFSKNESVLTYLFKRIRKLSREKRFERINYNTNINLVKSIVSMSIRRRKELLRWWTATVFKPEGKQSGLVHTKGDFSFDDFEK